MPPKRRSRGSSAQPKSNQQPPPGEQVQVHQHCISPVANDVVGVLASSDPICAIAVGSSELCLGHHNGIVTLRKIDEATSQHAAVVEIAAHRGMVRALQVVHRPGKSDVLLSASGDGTVKAHELPSGKWLMTFSGHEGSVEAFSFLGDRLFSGGSEGRLIEWDLNSGSLLRAIKCHVGRVTALCIPAVASSSRVNDGEAEAPAAESLVPAPPPDTVITASDDTLAKLVHPQSSAVQGIFRCESAVTAVAYAHPNFIAGCADGCIRGFDVHTAQHAFLFKGHTDAVNAINPASKWLISVSEDMSVRLWNTRTWKVDHTFGGHAGSVTCLAVDGEHRRLYTGGFDSAARVWALDDVLRYVHLVEEAAVAAAPKPGKKAPTKGPGKGLPMRQK